MVNGVKVLEVGGWRLENRSERSESKDPPLLRNAKDGAPESSTAKSTLPV